MGDRLLQMGRGFRDLKVWQRSKILAIYIYRITATGKISKEFSLWDQIRRASVSICSAIAEGDERNSDKDLIRFFNIAKESLAELITRIGIAVEMEFLEKAEAVTLLDECEEVGKMLGTLIKARNRR